MNGSVAPHELTEFSMEQVKTFIYQLADAFIRLLFGFLATLGMVLLAVALPRN
jgi:hypothetical protein